MILKNFSIARSGFYFLTVFAFGSILSAAPRLSLSQTAFTVSTVAGQNGPSQVVFAANKGDGTLNLQATSSVTWLTATIGPLHLCGAGDPVPNCENVTLALQTAALAKGTFTGIVTLSDPNAIDAPQSITVTVQVGGAVPDKVEFFVPPNGTASSSPFTTATRVNTTVSGGPWLSIAMGGAGTFNFNVPYIITATAQSGMNAGDFNGSVTLTGSSFAPDNKTISVLLHVTAQPIVQLSSNTVALRAIQGGQKQTATLAISNAGPGTLSVTGATAAAAAAGTWLSAQLVNNNAAVTITADPTGLAPNTYTGTVTIASNAANNNLVVPVQFVVAAQTAPVAFAGGAVNNGTFAAGEALAQGDIAAIFGDQFTLGGTQVATLVPLPQNLAGTQVFVNDQPTPLYFISAGQIDFQVPFEAATGPGTVRVDRNGQRGNQIFVNIAPRVPRFLVFNGVNGVITTPDTPPVVTGTSDHPVKAGDVIIMYTIGLGQTNPAVQTGVASPSVEPLARVGNVQVCFGSPIPIQLPICNPADFAGLAPNFVGLYQVNFTIPQNAPKGDTRFYFVVGNTESNVVTLTVQ